MFSFGVASNYIVAQEGADPAQLAQADAKKNNKGFAPLTEEELLSKIFPEDKSSCTVKANLFTAIGKKYSDGDALEDFVSVAVFRPVMERYYTQIRESGLVQASLDNIREYQNCVKSAKPHKDAKKEKELATKHRKCVKFSKVVLETLDAIKRRKSASSVIENYQNNPLDMSGTVFGEVSNPVVMFMGQLFKIGKTQSYDDAVWMGQAFVASCAG